MKYTFDILGVSPVLYFFNQQQERQQQKPRQGVEYVATYKCSLDAVIQSVENVNLRERGWDLEQVVDTVINFWVSNSDSIQYWKERLNDAGKQTLLVGRVGDENSLRVELESLLGKGG